MAKYFLAISYENGAGVKKSLNKAYSLYLEAAKLGVRDCKVCVGRCLYYGIGTKQSHSEAMKWYKKAAKQGDGEAQYVLAGSYEFGDGVKKNKRWAK